MSLKTTLILPSNTLNVCANAICTTCSLNLLLSLFKNDRPNPDQALLLKIGKDIQWSLIYSEEFLFFLTDMYKYTIGTPIFKNSLNKIKGYRGLF